MGFGLNYDSQASGDIIPICKFDARAGRMFRVDRKDGNNTPVDITRAFRAVFDLENVEVGFIDFNTGGAPAFTLVPLGDPMPNNPGNGAKQGIRIMMRLSKDCGGDVRELATCAKAAMRGLDQLHSAYQAAAGDNPNKLPVVAIKDTIPITSEGQGQKTTNYQPVFEIVSWADRPPDLVFKPKGRGRGEAPTQRPTPPSTGSTQVPPPVAKEPAMAGGDDFG